MNFHFIMESVVRIQDFTICICSVILFMILYMNMLRIFSTSIYNVRSKQITLDTWNWICIFWHLVDLITNWYSGRYPVSEYSYNVTRSALESGRFPQSFLFLILKCDMIKAKTDASKEVSTYFYGEKCDHTIITFGWSTGIFLKTMSSAPWGRKKSLTLSDSCVDLYTGEMLISDKTFQSSVLFDSPIH